MKYKKNFLTHVICKIDFPKLEKYNAETLKTFQQLIKEHFPVIQEIRKIVIEQTVSEGESTQRKTEDKVYLFRDKTDKEIIQLEPTSIIIEYLLYKNFEEFYESVKLAIECLFKIYPNIISTRIGLRYVNHIEIPGDTQFLKWDGLINSNLLSSIKFLKVPEKLSQYAGMMELNEDEYTLRFQYGILNSNYPSTLTKKEFDLDYDYSTKNSIEKVSEILSTIREFNTKITVIFENSIEKSLREIMGVIE
jgi:uncharacterized protein (TIGR04255 family)